MPRSSACANSKRPAQLQSDQIDALGRSLDDLTRQLAEASAAERPALAEAFAELAQGRSLAAEDAFERAYEAQQRAAEASQRTMAEAARKVANLALLRDIAKAVRFYRKALAAEADGPETSRLLGHARMVVGDLHAAEKALATSLAAATARADSWSQMAAQGGLGDAFLKTRNLAAASGAFTAALAAYRQSLGIFEALTRCDPANTQWQVALAMSCAKLGVSEGGQGVEKLDERRALLLRGREILQTLKATGRLQANQDWIGWFDDRLAELPPGAR